MKGLKLTIYALLVIQAIISESLADISQQQQQQQLQHPLHLQQDAQASTKSSAVSTLGGRIPRQSRCIRCSYPYDDRYGGSRTDDYYGGGSYGGGNYGGGSYGGGSYGGNSRYYSGGASSRVGYDDRNWYYYPDRYDDRNSRYQDRYGSSSTNGAEPAPPSKQYDDRYASRTYDRYDSPSGYYDRNDYRSYNDFRGNGYDNRDSFYRGGSSSSDGYYRDRGYDRNRGGYEGRYNDRDVYDKYYYKGGYDFRNYRPWDDTYRGTSGFDNSGRGYYFASRPDEPLPPRRPSSSSFHYRPEPPLPPLSHHSGERNPPSSQSYSPHAQAPPRPLDSPNSSSSSSSSSSGDPSAPSSASSSSTGPSSSSSSSHHYQHNRPEDDSNKGYAGSWSYVNERDKGTGYNDNNRDRDRDRDMGPGYNDRDKNSQSNSYGSRPRPLGGAYLLDRDTNSPVPVMGENKDGKIDDKSKVSAVSKDDSSSSSPSNSLIADTKTH